jgi:hypothetical protein
MKILLTTLLFFSFESHAICTKKVDPKRTVIFIDANNGGQEVETARAAACNRGDSFVVFPENGSCTNGCRDHLKTTLSSLKAKGSAPVSVILSGHDGGGNYSGTYGNISRSDITRMFSEDFPEFKNSVESLYLLGCYTGVKYEVFSWMSGFLELKFIAGYEGSAPSSTRLAGHAYIEHLMLQEKQLINQANQANIKNDIEKIPYMEQLTSSIVVRALQCEDPETNKPTDFYYRSKPVQGEKMEILNSADCVEKIGKSKEKSQEFTKYYNGELPVPADTANGPLRHLYNFYRSAEHCFNGDSNVPKGDQVLGMLFYPGYAANIARFFGDLSASLTLDLNNLSFDTWKQTLDQEILELEAQMKEYEKEIAEFKKDPVDFRARMKAKTDALDMKLTRITETEAGRAIFAYFETHQVEASELPSPPLDEKKVQEVSAIMDEYKESYMQDDDERLVENKTHMIETIEKRRDEIKAIERTEAKFSEMKTSAFIPNQDNIKGKTRKEHTEGLHKFYNLANKTYGLPVGTRKKAVALSKNYEKMLGSLKCLPLSWHEAHNNPLERPICGITKPERVSGRVNTSYDSSFYLESFNE